jgi:hypothetical protein
MNARMPDDRPGGGAGGPVAGRGILLVAGIAALGVLLLWRALDNPAPGDTVVAGTTTTVAETTTLVPPGTTTTTLTTVDPAAVKVIVANAAGVQGAAGRMTDSLKAKNYVTLSPTTAQQKDLATTAVYYVDGNQAAAQQVATDIGAPATAVQLIPVPPPAGVDIKDAVVLVLLGQDLAK